MRFSFLLLCHGSVLDGVAITFLFDVRSSPRLLDPPRRLSIHRVKLTKSAAENFLLQKTDENCQKTRFLHSAARQLKSAETNYICLHWHLDGVPAQKKRCRAARERA
jgi:hypothetical protein